MLKEQMVYEIWEVTGCRSGEAEYIAKVLLNLFRAEVEKLTVIDTVLIDGCIVKAQLQHTKKQLLDLIGG